jgi:hypothetical protein
LKYFALALLTATLLTGCAMAGHLYPVQGPLATRAPLPIFNIEIDLNDSSMSATLQNGEVCKGNWAQLRRDDPSANRMSAQWDAVYGQGFFVAHILGSGSLGRGLVTGPQGTTLNVETFNPTAADFKGIAQDNKGNLYKMTL